MNYESLARNKALAWLGRPTVRLIHAADPTRCRLHEFATTTRPDAGLVCVYRSRNAPTVLPIVQQALRLRIAVALWALDSPVTSLARETVGSGPGPRLGLLNRLYARLPASITGQILVCDDDVVFTRGGLGELLSLAETCGFGLAQPAHAPGSYINHAITRARPLTLARVTTYVETGPMLVIAPDWRSRILPFPEDLGMGWGISLLWTDLQQDGCRLGIVDAVSLRHLAPAARDYEVRPEAERAARMMQVRGIQHLPDFQRTAIAWHFWRRKPPWSRSDVTSSGP